jgi:transcriptional regulator with XRE-family HTH domain
MPNFSMRLRSEIDYLGLNQKEFAAKIGIKRRTLDTYLGIQQSMPPADTAVKMAAALGVSVEYLITGKEYQQYTDISKYLQYKDLLDDLSELPEETVSILKSVIKVFAENEQKKR